MRIPYPIEEKQMYYINDFRVLHFAYLNSFRTESKRRFYTFIDWEMNHRSTVSLERSYAQTKLSEQVNELPSDYIFTKENGGFDMWELIDTDSPKSWFDDYIVERLHRHSTNDLRKLPLWDDVFCSTYSIEDPRRFIDRVVHKYLERTKRNNNLLIRGIDKILKIVYK